MKFSVFDYTESAVAIWTFEFLDSFKNSEKKAGNKNFKKKTGFPNSQLYVENCVFNFRCLLAQCAQCYLQVVITSLLFVYQMWIVKCSV